MHESHGLSQQCKEWGSCCFLPPTECGKAGGFDRRHGYWLVGIWVVSVHFKPCLTSCAAGTSLRTLWETEPAFAHLSASSDEAKMINRSTVRSSTNQREIKTPFSQVLDMSVLILFSDRVLTPCHATSITIN